MKTETLQLRLDPGLKQQIDSIARQADLSRSAVCRWAIKVLLERLTTHPEDTLLLLMSAPGERVLEEEAT